MHPQRVRRDHLHRLTDLPNVGPAFAADLQALGLHHPADCAQQDPWLLFQRLCALQGAQDPCVLDVLISITRFLAGEPARVWWDYTDERRARWPELNRRPR